MGLWKRMLGFEKRETLEDLLISSGLLTKSIERDQAMNIPALSACVDLISDTVAAIPIKFYKEQAGKVTVIDDDRVKLLNDDTKDTLDGFQFKKALVEDYLLDGAGYSYINRERNKVKSLHFVKHESVSINMNVDPIFKSYNILVQGETYRDYEFLKLTRRSKDGVTGKGIIEQNNKLLSVAYNTLIFEEVLVKTGGNKKGFLKSQGRLSKEAVDELKLAWKNLYANNDENVVVLNNGLDFHEASNTSVEMQLNENKKTNSIEIQKVLKVPTSILEGKASDDEYNLWIKICILPILVALITAINKDLLLPSEKNESFYFAFDTKELFKGDMLKRYQAYEIAIKNGFMQWDEVRYNEDLEPYGVDFIKLGLQDVLYNPKTKEIYTPNTNQTNNMDELKGGETKNANRDSKQSGAA
ncbi:phage portal protein [Neobacillus vireti]|uniref:phage portal protein n=1 Tax=Neobacillus vireti TaxID=220686 RepID=UPI002FFF3628